MLKRSISTLLTAAAFLAGTALLAPEASAVTVTSTKKVTLKLAHPNPETHIFHKAALEFKKEVEAKSNGNITVNIFPANQLGGSQGDRTVRLPRRSGAEHFRFRPVLRLQQRS